MTVYQMYAPLSSNISKNKIFLIKTIHLKSDLFEIYPLGPRAVVGIRDILPHQLFQSEEKMELVFEDTEKRRERK